MKKLFLYLLTMMLVVCMAIPSCTAVSGYGYPIIRLPADEAERIYENQNFVIYTKNLDLSQFEKSIVSFAVSDDGYIALAFAGQSVLVLDPQEKPITLIDFDNGAMGSYGVEFNGNNVCLYSVCGDTIFEFDVEGEFVNVVKPLFPSEKASDYFQSILGRNRREIVANGITYRLENDVMIMDILTGGHFKRLVKVTDGQTEIVYEKWGSDDLVSQIVVALLVVSSIALIIAMGIQSIKDSRTELKQGTPETQHRGRF